MECRSSIHNICKKNNNGKELTEYANGLDLDQNARMLNVNMTIMKKLERFTINMNNS